MNKIILAGILVVFLSLVPICAQQTQSQNDNEVVKVSTNLVQVDAVVTDKNGNPVTNLTADDFEILQDGKPQKITNFSYIKRNVATETANQTFADKKTKKSAPLSPSVSARTAEPSRILTFVVDDGSCETTSLGVLAMQSGLEKFINEQMQPNDLVAIYRTRAGSSLLQQYTSDKARLLSIVRKIRWYPPEGFCTNLTGSDYEPARDNSTLKSGGQQTFETTRDKERREELTDSVKDARVTSVIGVMRYAINGLQRTGGRKMLFLLSDSLAINNGKVIYRNTLDAARDLTALANRASVVINTIDDRGLTAPGASANDNIRVGKDLPATVVDTVLAERRQSDESRQSGLFYVADETGGKFYKNMNFLDVPIKKILNSEQDYYLIGYQPKGDTFEGKKFHKIEIKLKRPSLQVNSRSGFYGITDEAMRPKQRTGDSELYDALAAPLPNADMDVKLSAYFANSPDKGNLIRALLYVEGKDIAFVDDAAGKKAVFDIVAVTLDEKNKVIDDSNYTQTVHIPLNEVEEIRRNGLIYMVDVPVKKDGVYTFRTALRNAATPRLGTASQVIEVPDLKKGKLFVSGLIVSGVDANGKIYPPEATGADNKFLTVVSKAVPAIRQFRRNSIMAYVYTIYNAKIDATSNQPKLSIQTNLYYNGKLISEGQPQAAQIEKQPDMTRLRDYAYLRLNPNVPVGDYTLQIIVKDLLTNQSTSQSVDFEVVE
ncbi:MAG: VWA domain-containing protein [Pyrinomonadaceae bacterium]